MFLTILLSLTIIFRDIVSTILGTLSKYCILIFLEKVRNYFAKIFPCRVLTEQELENLIFLLLHVLFKQLFLTIKASIFKRFERDLRAIF